MKSSTGIAVSVSYWTVPREPSSSETRAIVFSSGASTTLTKSKWPSVAHRAFTVAPSCSISLLPARMRAGVLRTVCTPSGVSVESMIQVGTGPPRWVRRGVVPDPFSPCPVLSVLDGYFSDDRTPRRAPPRRARRTRRDGAGRRAGGHRGAAEGLLRLGLREHPRGRRRRGQRLHPRRPRRRLARRAGPAHGAGGHGGQPPRPGAPGASSAEPRARLRRHRRGARQRRQRGHARLARDRAEPRDPAPACPSLEAGDVPRARLHRPRADLRPLPVQGQGATDRDADARAAAALRDVHGASQADPGQAPAHRDVDAPGRPAAALQPGAGQRLRPRLDRRTAGVQAAPALTGSPTAKVRSPSAASTRIWSPAPKSPWSRPRASGSTRWRWITRLSGRAPYTGS